MLAYLPSLAPFTPAVLVCVFTMPVGLMLVLATPRLAIATVYWSVATLLVASPMIFDAPWQLIVGVPIGGIVLNLILLVDYRHRRRGTRPGDG